MLDLKLVQVLKAGLVDTPTCAQTPAYAFLVPPPWASMPVRGTLLTRPLAGESASILRPAAAICILLPSCISGLETVSTSGEGVSGTVA